MERGMSNTVASPILCLGAGALKSRLEESGILLSVFEDCVKETDDLISGGYSFMLVAPDGVLLKKKPGKRKKSRSFGN